MLLTHVVFVLDNYVFSFCLHLVWRFQQNMTILCLFSLSISFFLSHFKSDLYIKMQHPQTATFSMLAMILTSFVIVVTLSIHCMVEELCFPRISIKVNIIILTQIAILNVIIIIDISIKKHIQSFIKWVKFPIIIPFHGPLQQDPIELRTISKGSPSGAVTLPSPVTASYHEHVTINTGLLTIMFMTAGAGLIIKLCLYLFSPNSSSYEKRYAIVCPTFLLITAVIPIYWTCANNDLGQFAKRFIKKLVTFENN